MKKGLTEIIFILDRSGSMSGLESDTIGGFNSLIEKQKQEEGEAFVTTVLFDDSYEVLHNRINIKEIELMTPRQYYVRGTTALLDAIGRTIDQTIKAQEDPSKDGLIENVMFIIITDGMENASREYNYEKVRKMIKYQKAEYDWEFIFLGANIDAGASAEHLGISKDKSANYYADSQGTRLNYEVLSDVVSMKRSNEEINESWKERIDEDYKKRKNK